MSRQNKVNPGMYTQRGRLTQDDAARELRKQASIGSQHTWQPVKKNALPRLDPKDRAAGTETTEDKGSEQQTSPDIESRPAARATKGDASMKKAAKSKAKTSKTQTAKSGNATTSGKKKTAKSAKSAAKSTGAKPKRKAVLARNVGGGGASPRSAAKRRKS
jgi:hypothetical protein